MAPDPDIVSFPLSKLHVRSVPQVPDAAVLFSYVISIGISDSDAETSGTPNSIKHIAADKIKDSNFFI